MGTSAGDRENRYLAMKGLTRDTHRGHFLTQVAQSCISQRVDLHFVGGRVIEHERRTCVLAGGFITEPAADLPWEGWCDCQTPRRVGPQPSVSRCLSEPEPPESTLNRAERLFSSKHGFLKYTVLAVIVLRRL